MKFSGWWALLAIFAVAGVASVASAQDETDSEVPQMRRSVDTGTSGDKAGNPSRDDVRRALTSEGLQLPGSVDPDTYRLGPGDVLQFTVWGGISRTMGLEVGPEGLVLLPTTGPLRVDGLTLREARTQITNRMRPQFHGVNIDLSLLRPRRFLVYVTGEVKYPGAMEANGSSRVSDVVLIATPLDNGSMRQVQVMHRDGSRETADLDLFIRTSSQAINPWLRDGDVVHIPRQTSFIFIQGAVARSARFELGPRDSLRTLIALGGGLLPAADTTRALLVRWTNRSSAESVWVNPPQVLSGAFNPPLHNGDRLYVYFSPQFQVVNEVTILGEVQHPGPYPVQVGRDHLSDLIRAAGGFLPGADLAAIRVRRKSTLATSEDQELQRLIRLSRSELTNSEYDVLNTKLAGMREEYRIDWARLQSKPELDVLLVGGDIIQVDRLVNSIRVDGQVRRPGIMSYKPGESLREYIAASGGFSERAWEGKIRVTRSVTGQTFLARDVQKLDPGDFIWVPEKPDVTFWDQARTVLSAAAEIATVYLAFHTVGK